MGNPDIDEMFQKRVADVEKEIDLIRSMSPSYNNWIQHDGLPADIYMIAMDFGNVGMAKAKELLDSFEKSLPCTDTKSGQLKMLFDDIKETRVELNKMEASRYMEDYLNTFDDVEGAGKTILAEHEEELLDRMENNDDDFGL